MKNGQRLRKKTLLTLCQNRESSLIPQVFYCSSRLTTKRGPVWLRFFGPRFIRGALGQVMSLPSRVLYAGP